MSDLTIRRADPRDAGALARLAALDSSHAPVGDVLMAEVGDELRAALSVASGEIIADPFRRTAELVPILQLRAEQLRSEVEGSRRRRRIPRPAPRSV